MLHRSTLFLLFFLFASCWCSPFVRGQFTLDLTQLSQTFGDTDNPTAATTMTGRVSARGCSIVVRNCKLKKLTVSAGFASGCNILFEGITLSAQLVFASDTQFGPNTTVTLRNINVVNDLDLVPLKVETFSNLWRSFTIEDSVFRRSNSGIPDGGKSGGPWSVDYGCGGHPVPVVSAICVQPPRTHDLWDGTCLSMVPGAEEPTARILPTSASSSSYRSVILRRVTAVVSGYGSESRTAVTEIFAAVTLARVGNNAASTDGVAFPCFNFSITDSVLRTQIDPAFLESLVVNGDGSATNSLQAEAVNIHQASPPGYFHLARNRITVANRADARVVNFHHPMTWEGLPSSDPLSRSVGEVKVVSGFVIDIDSNTIDLLALNAHARLIDIWGTSDVIDFVLVFRDILIQRNTHNSNSLSMPGVIDYSLLYANQIYVSHSILFRFNTLTIVSRDRGSPNGVHFRGLNNTLLVSVSGNSIKLTQVCEKRERPCESMYLVAVAVRDATNVSAFHFHGNNINAGQWPSRDLYTNPMPADWRMKQLFIFDFAETSVGCGALSVRDNDVSAQTSTSGFVFLATAPTQSENPPPAEFFGGLVVSGNVVRVRSLRAGMAEWPAVPTLPWAPANLTRFAAGAGGIDVLVQPGSNKAIFVGGMFGSPGISISNNEIHDNRIINKTASGGGAIRAITIGETNPVNITGDLAVVGNFFTIGGNLDIVEILRIGMGVYFPAVVNIHDGNLLFNDNKVYNGASGQHCSNFNYKKSATAAEIVAEYDGYQQTWEEAEREARNSVLRRHPALFDPVPWLDPRQAQPSTFRRNDPNYAAPSRPRPKCAVPQRAGEFVVVALLHGAPVRFIETEDEAAAAADPTKNRGGTFSFCGNTIRLYDIVQNIKYLFIARASHEFDGKQWPLLRRILYNNNDISVFANPHYADASFWDSGSLPAEADVGRNANEYWRHIGLGTDLIGLALGVMPRFSTVTILSTSNNILVADGALNRFSPLWGDSTWEVHAGAFPNLSEGLDCNNNTIACRLCYFTAAYAADTEGAVFNVTGPLSVSGNTLLAVSASRTMIDQGSVKCRFAFGSGKDNLGPEQKTRDVTKHLLFAVETGMEMHRGGVFNDNYVRVVGDSTYYTTTETFRLDCKEERDCPRVSGGPLRFENNVFEGATYSALVLAPNIDGPSGGAFIFRNNTQLGARATNPLSGQSQATMVHMMRATFRAPMVFAISGNFQVNDLGTTMPDDTDILEVFQTRLVVFGKGKRFIVVDDGGGGGGGQQQQQQPIGIDFTITDNVFYATGRHAPLVNFVAIIGMFRRSNSVDGSDLPPLQFPLTTRRPLRCRLIIARNRGVLQAAQPGILGVIPVQNLSATTGFWTSDSGFFVTDNYFELVPGYDGLGGLGVVSSAITPLTLRNNSLVGVVRQSARLANLRAPMPGCASPRFGPDYIRVPDKVSKKNLNRGLSLLGFALNDLMFTCRRESGNSFYFSLFGNSRTVPAGAPMREEHVYENNLVSTIQLPTAHNFLLAVPVEQVLPMHDSMHISAFGNIFRAAPERAPKGPLLESVAYPSFVSAAVNTVTGQFNVEPSCPILLTLEIGAPRCNMIETAVSDTEIRSSRPMIAKFARRQLPGANVVVVDAEGNAVSNERYAPLCTSASFTATATLTRTLTSVTPVPTPSRSQSVVYVPRVFGIDVAAAAAQMSATRALGAAAAVAAPTAALSAARAMAVFALLSCGGEVQLERDGDVTLWFNWQMSAGGAVALLTCLVLLVAPFFALLMGAVVEKRRRAAVQRELQELEDDEELVDLLPKGSSSNSRRGASPSSSSRHSPRSSSSSSPRARTSKINATLHQQAAEERGFVNGVLAVAPLPDLITKAAAQTVPFLALAAGTLIGDANRTNSTTSPGGAFVGAFLPIAVLLGVLLYFAWRTHSVLKRSSSGSGDDYKRAPRLAPSLIYRAPSSNNNSNGFGGFASKVSKLLLHPAGRFCLTGWFTWQAPRTASFFDAKAVTGSRRRLEQTYSELLRRQNAEELLLRCKRSLTRFWGPYHPRREQDELQREATMDLDEMFPSNSKRSSSSSRNHSPRSRSSNNNNQQDFYEGGGPIWGCTPVSTGGWFWIQVRSQLAPHFLILTLFVTLIVVMVQGAATGARAERDGGCAHAMRTAAAINFLFAVAVLILRPFLVPLQNFVMCALELVIGLVSVIASAAVFESGRDELAAPLQETLSSAAMVGSVLLGGSAALRIVLLRVSASELVPRVEIFRRGRADAQHKERYRRRMERANDNEFREDPLLESLLYAPGSKALADAKQQQQSVNKQKQFTLRASGGAAAGGGGGGGGGVGGLFSFI